MLKAVVISALVLSGCAASIEEAKIDLKDPVQHKEDAFELRGKRVPIPSSQAEAWECLRTDQSSTSWVLVVNPDTVTFDDKACEYGVVKEFAEKKWNVLVINRPGFGKSLPKDQDAGGPDSIAMIQAAAQSKGVVGIWAQGMGAGAAAFASKKVKSVQWLLLANGIYDMEAFIGSSQDPRYADWIAAARRRGDDSMFTEYRSVAWDASGLPKKIYLYTSAANPVIPQSQSESLRDTLKATGKYDVKYEPIQGVGLDIEATKERVIIDRLLSPS